MSPAPSVSAAPSTGYPSIVDDQVDPALPDPNLFVEVLENDTVGRGGGALRVTRCLLPDATARTFLTRDLTKEEFEDRGRFLQDVILADSARCSKGGLCAPTADRREVRYTRPLPTNGVAFVGIDTCEYEACDDKERCGTARVILNVVKPPTASPSGVRRLTALE